METFKALIKIANNAPNEEIFNTEIISECSQSSDEPYDTDVRDANNLRLLRSAARPQIECKGIELHGDSEKQDWKKTIMVGARYQCTIPEDLCPYDDALPYENDDTLLWNPYLISASDTELYLRRAKQLQLSGISVNSVPLGAHLRDDEQALYLLKQCGHNSDEALRRIRLHAVPSVDTMSLWSEEECRNFEIGLRIYGKNFYLIKQNKVRTRSVGELIQFYYLWKKTERHDVFAHKERLDKTKYSLKPGVVDYIDRILDEHESEQSSSPEYDAKCVANTPHVDKSED